jgi:phospholipid/cholesterol/gamma-HCH transport system substrate-binding protein
VNKTATEIVVGLAFVIGVLLLGAYTIMISGVTLGATKKYVVDFEQIYGLKEGDGVRVEGHEMGEVKELRLLPGGKIRAVLVVSADVEIYKDGGEVQVVPFSPLGGRVVEIKRGNENEARGAHAFFDSPGGGSLADVTEADAIQGTAQGELLQTLNALVEENRESVGRIVKNLEHVSTQLTKTDNAVGYLINDKEGAKRLSEVATGMSSSAQRLDRILERVEGGEGVVGGLLTEDSPLERDVNRAMGAGREAIEGVGEIVARANRGESAVGVLVSENPQTTAAVEGIIQDVKVVTGTVAEGKGSLGKFVHDERLYDGAAGTAENLESITTKIDSGKGLLGVLLEEESGENARKTLGHLASITGAIDDPEGGTLGLIVHDQALRNRVVRITEEIESLVVEFRDSIEDLREQAPVNAFVGAVLSAF